MIKITLKTIACSMLMTNFAVASCGNAPARALIFNGTIVPHFDGPNRYTNKPLSIDRPRSLKISYKVPAVNGLDRHHLVIKAEHITKSGHSKNIHAIRNIYDGCARVNIPRFDKYDIKYSTYKQIHDFFGNVKNTNLEDFHKCILKGEKKLETASNKFRGYFRFQKEKFKFNTPLIKKITSRAANILSRAEDAISSIGVNEAVASQPATRYVVNFASKRFISGTSSCASFTIPNIPNDAKETHVSVVDLTDKYIRSDKKYSEHTVVFKFN